jgi:hypothetical protein
MAVIAALYPYITVNNVWSHCPEGSEVSRKGRSGIEAGNQVKGNR